MQKKLKELARRMGQQRAALVIGLMLAGSQAHAALPTEVTAAITTAGTDLLAGATAVIVAMVAFWGMRKLGAKMGWW